MSYELRATSYELRAAPRPRPAFDRLRSSLIVPQLPVLSYELRATSYEPRPVPDRPKIALRSSPTAQLPISPSAHQFLLTRVKSRYAVPSTSERWTITR